MTESYSSHQSHNDGDDFTLPITSTHNDCEETPICNLGVDIQQVNPTIFHIVEKIFAKPLKGLEFLALLLTQAVVKQEALSASSEQIPIAYAVISLQNIRELAQRIHWGYDTTHKYVVTLCALNLLIKRRSSDRIELLFPLQHYDPPSSLHELDRLLAKSRPKVQQFAKRVRERCLIYDIIAASTTVPAPGSSITPPSPEQELMTRLHSILRTENIDAERRQRLVMRISSEIIGKLLTYPSAQVSSPKQGRLAAPGVQANVNELESTFSGRLFPEASSSSELESTFTVDSLPPHMTKQQESTFAVDPSKASQESAPSKSTFAVDSSPQITSMEKKSPVPGRLSDKQLAANKPESPSLTRVDSKKAPYPAQKQKAPGKPNALGTLISRSSTFDTRLKSTQPKMVDSRLEQVDSLQVQETAVVDSFPTQVDFDTPMPESLENLPTLVDLPIESASQADGELDFTNTKSTAQNTPSVDSEAQTGKTLVDLDFYSQEFAELYVTLDVRKLFNNILNKNNTNVTLRMELQKFLAEVFDRNRQAASKYKKMFEATDTSTVIASFIYSLQCMSGSKGHTIENPGAFFNSNCNKIQNKKLSISQKDIDFLGQLTCEQIYDYLTNPNSKIKLAPLFDQPGQQELATGDSNGHVVRRNGKLVYRATKFTHGKLGITKSQPGNQDLH